jgi:asparagine synthase (glutamine-hydrolysing)
MCGITGILLPQRSHKVNLSDELHAMTAALNHRGPDDRGYWQDEHAGLYFGHQRLAIIDLSVEGQQPMLSPTGRYVLAYNGEIYNFPELRRDLEEAGVVFRGHSDTEVLLAAIEAWGLEASIARCVGMFAFSLWDRQERVLSLVRDRLGIKPLYYGLHDGGLLFGSELKALTAASFFHKEIDHSVVPLYLRYNYIPEPYTIWKNTYKLEPGSILQIDADKWRSTGIEPGVDGVKKVVYWSAREKVVAGVRNPLRSSTEAVVELLEGQLLEAVRDRMIADVPLGAFLSGGVDSSAVVALMQELSNSAVKTFSIGFAEEQFNEAHYAAAVAQHLGTDHTELYVTPSDTMDVIPLLPRMYDEPYSDYSNIPTYLVSKLARQKVTVSLSGDGGDELFGGYNRHMLIDGLWNRLSRMPAILRKFGASTIHSISPQSWDRLAGMLGMVLPPGKRLVDPGYKLHKLAEVLAARDPKELYHGLISEWNNPAQVLMSRDSAAAPVLNDPIWNSMDDLANIIMYLDLATYLPGDILTKVDRASMAVSLESRVPILDHRVVELAWRLPQELKIKDGEGKWILRQILYKRVPKQLIERPKQGFTVPVGEWLRAPLREWAEELLDSRALEQSGIFNAKAIGKIWQQHLRGSRNHDSKLWPVLMFEAWRRAV